MQYCKSLVTLTLCYRSLYNTRQIAKSQVANWSIFFFPLFTPSGQFFSLPHYCEMAAPRRSQQAPGCSSCSYSLQVTSPVQGKFLSRMSCGTQLALATVLKSAWLLAKKKFQGKFGHVLWKGTCALGEILMCRKYLFKKILGV